MGGVLLARHASRYLRLVEECGETIEVTERGRTIALLTPIPTASRVEALIASGRLRRGRRGPLPAPIEPLPSQLLPSQILDELRADDR